MTLLVRRSTLEFSPGTNIAVKVPTHEYAAMLRFYRDVLGLQPLDKQDGASYTSQAFDFDGKTLWVDQLGSLSQAEISWRWLRTPSRPLKLI